jgi:hypothetical protein
VTEVTAEPVEEVADDVNELTEADRAEAQARYLGLIAGQRPGPETLFLHNF